MSVRESVFNKRLRTELSQFQFKFDRVESPGTAPGIPDDSWVHESGAAGWIEIKEAQKLPSKIDYRPDQAAWLENHWAHGGNCCTMVHVKDGDYIIVVPGHCSGRAEVDLLALPMWNRVHVWLRESAAWSKLASIILNLRKGL